MVGGLSLWAQVATSAVRGSAGTQTGTSNTTVLSYTLEGSLAPRLAQGCGQTRNGIGDQGPWAPVVPAACASSPALPSFPPPPADVLRCLNQIPSPATPPLPLLISDGRRGRERRGESSCWLLPAAHLPTSVTNKLCPCLTPFPQPSHRCPTQPSQPFPGSVVLLPKPAEATHCPPQAPRCS